MFLYNRAMKKITILSMISRQYFKNIPTTCICDFSIMLVKMAENDQNIKPTQTCTGFNFINYLLLYTKSVRK